MTSSGWVWSACFFSLLQLIGSGIQKPKNTNVPLLYLFLFLCFYCLAAVSIYCPSFVASWDKNSNILIFLQYLHLKICISTKYLFIYISQLWYTILSFYFVLILLPSSWFHLWDMNYLDACCQISQYRWMFQFQLVIDL